MSDNLNTLIVRDLELMEDTQLPPDEETLIAVLSDLVEELMMTRMEFLLSSLYRLDVSEQQVSAALHPNAPELASFGIARLIVNRQKQRLATRQAYSKPPNAPNWWEEES